MGLFGEKKTKEEKEEQKLEKFMAKYNLSNLEPTDLKVLERIYNDLAGNGFFKAGMAFSFAKAEEQAKVNYLSALVEQNWLIINQLASINSKLSKLNIEEE